MNRPPDEFRRIAEKDLLIFATACLQHAGMPGDQAALLARCLVNSDLRGVRSHGTRALGGYCGALRRGAVNADPEIRVLKETDVAIHIDGGGGLGYSPMMMATEAAVRKARARGVAVGAARSIGHYGSAGHYVRRAMEEGCTAFSVQGSYPQYYESNEGKRAMYYGNPPLSFGLPSAAEPPVVLDCATCIMADDWRGPEYEALETLIPAAFFKSMGYTAVASALGGVFAGLADEACQETRRRYPSARLGGMVWVMDIGLFCPPEDFRHGIDAMVRLAREQMIPLQGYGETTLPGAVEDRLEKDQRDSGIRIGTEDAARLDELAAGTGIAIDWM